MGSLGSRVRVHIGIPVVRTDGLRAAYGHVITKFSVMGRFTYPWCSARALRARSSAKNVWNAPNALWSRLFGPSITRHLITRVLTVTWNLRKAQPWRKNVSAVSTTRPKKVVVIKRWRSYRGGRTAGFHCILFFSTRVKEFINVAFIFRFWVLCKYHGSWCSD